jgi:hypothetical protein
VAGESLDWGTVTPQDSARAMMLGKKNKIAKTAWAEKILTGRADLFPKMLAWLGIP